MAPKKSVKAVPTEEPATTEFVLEKGDIREFPLAELSEEVVQNRTLPTSKERILIGVLITMALVVRASNLQNPNSVVFDEVHFGKFAAHYINRNFFMDVHPPLAKMLFAAAGYIGGFKGNFMFEEIGKVFPPDVPYVIMRQLSAFMGVATVMFCYFTLRASGCKPIVAFVTASLLVLENGFHTISRYILLDSPLVFFIAGTAYFYTRFEISKVFSLEWFKYLALASLFLGFSLSAKWVGLFTVAWVGVANLLRLWFFIGDLTVSKCSIWKQTAFRGVFFLGVTFAVYLFSFYIHILILNKEGDSAGFLSSAFRRDFIDSTVPKETFADVGVSSVVTLKHLGTLGGYLHSHDHLYEGGSEQQQVTLYPHLDDNNKWYVELYNETMEPFKFVEITDGTKIRLRHINTNRRLHSHDVRPAVSAQDWQNEASCYGYEGFEGDPNDDFVVQIVKEKSLPGVAQERLRAIDTVFVLRHAMTGCALWSHPTKLPKWGFEQQEVTCTGQGIAPLSYWYIEQNENIYLPRDAPMVSYRKMSFWQKFVELNKVMWNVNSKLTDTHVYQSRPEDWLFLKRGISYWTQQPSVIYLLGNPFVWWPASLMFLGFGIYAVVLIFKLNFGYEVTFNAETFTFSYAALEFLLGWFLHYFPFFIMGRQLFLHHYFPALYFAILALGHLLELVYTAIKSKKMAVYLVFGLIFTSALWSFYLRLPIAEGTKWTKEACLKSKWMTKWDYNCDSYPSVNGDSNVSEQLAGGIDFNNAVKAGSQKDEL